MSTRTSVCLYNQPVTWIFTRSRLSSLSDSDYKVISLAMDVKFGFYTVPIGNRTPGRRVAINYTTAAPRQLHAFLKLICDMFYMYRLKCVKIWNKSTVYRPARRRMLWVMQHPNPYPSETVHNYYFLNKFLCNITCYILFFSKYLLNGTQLLCIYI